MAPTNNDFIDLRNQVRLLENKVVLLQSLVSQLQNERKQFFSELDKIIVDRLHNSEIVKKIVEDQIESAKKAQERIIKEELKNIADMI